MIKTTDLAVFGSSIIMVVIILILLFNYTTLIASYNSVVDYHNEAMGALANYCEIDIKEFYEYQEDNNIQVTIDFNKFFQRED